MGDTHEKSEKEQKQQRQRVSPMIAIRSFNRKFFTPTGVRHDLSLSMEKRKKLLVVEDGEGLKQKLQKAMQDIEALPRLEINCRAVETKESEEESITPRRNRPILRRAILRDFQTPETTTSQKLEDCLKSVVLETVQAKGSVNQRTQTAMKQSNNQFGIQHKSTLKEPRKPTELAVKTTLGDRSYDLNGSSEFDLLNDAKQNGSLYTIEGTFFLDDDDRQKPRKKREKDNSTPPVIKTNKTTDKVAPKKINNFVTLDPMRNHNQTNDDASSIRVNTDGPQHRNRKLIQNIRYVKNKIQKDLHNSTLDYTAFASINTNTQNNSFLERSILINSKPNCQQIPKPLKPMEKGKNKKPHIDEEDEQILKRVSGEFERLLTSASPQKQKHTQGMKIEEASVMSNKTFFPAKTGHKWQTPKEKSKVLESKQKGFQNYESLMTQNQLDWIQEWVKVRRLTKDNLEKSILSLPVRSRQAMAAGPMQESLQKKYFMTRKFFAPSPSRNNKS